MQKLRKPYKEEIEFAKWMRTYKAEDASPTMAEFMQQAYFDIYDGISEWQANYLRIVARKYHSAVEVNLLNSLLEKQKPEEPVYKKQWGKKNQTMSDIDLALMKSYYSYLDHEELTKKDVETIHREVCKYLGVDFLTSTSSDRHKEYVEARNITAHLCRPKAKLQVIGSVINRGHVTVMHSLKEMDKNIGVNKTLLSKVIDLKSKLGL